MRGTTSATICALLAASAAACAPARSGAPAPARTDFAAAIDSIIDGPPLHRTHWGVHVVDAGTGAVVYSRNAERHFIPASNMKLVVGAVALALLGEEYRYRTEVRSSAQAGDSVATLLVAAVGDPTWSVRFHDSATAPLDSIAAAVARTGIRRTDELVVDASRFRDEVVNSTWEVGDLPFSSAPPVDALAVAEGTFRLVVSGGAVAGAPGAAHVIGAVAQPVRAVVRTDTAGARGSVQVDYTARRDTVLLHATVRAGGADTATLAVTRPADVAAAALAEALRRHNVLVGRVEVVRDSARAVDYRAWAGNPVVAWHSPPVRDIVAAILRPSQNWMAEQVLKTLGAELGTEGSWRGGLAVERSYLRDAVGIDSTSLNLRDASGLSAQNLLTPAATVVLLAHVRTQPWGPAYRAGLPTPGSPGTLASRLEGLETRLAAKTGTIANVNSLSGYLTTVEGRELIFSIYTNGSGLPAARVRRAIDDVVRAMAERSR